MQCWDDPIRMHAWPHPAMQLFRAHGHQQALHISRLSQCTLSLRPARQRQAVMVHNMYDVASSDVQWQPQPMPQPVPIQSQEAACMPPRHYQPWHQPMRPTQPTQQKVPLQPVQPLQRQPWNQPMQLTQPTQQRPTQQQPTRQQPMQPVRPTITFPALHALNPDGQLYCPEAAIRHCLKRSTAVEIFCQ